MARKTKRQKQKEMKLALGLLGLLLAAVLCAVSLAVPGFTDWAFRLAGVTPGATVPETGSDSPVAVHCIDIGQGHATLIEDDGAYTLVDAGPPESSDTLVAYMMSAGVERLDYLIMTHPHADHYGGMQAVLKAFPVGQMILPDLELAPYPTASTFLALLELLQSKGVPTTAAIEGDSYSLGGGLIRVVHGGLAAEDNYNLLSLGLRYQGDGLSLLITGDGEKANERAMLDGGFDLRSDVLLAGHHGSSTSNTEAFLQAVRPRLVMVSCAAGNGYGHPHNSALRAFEAVEARVLRTDKSGSIVIQPGAADFAVGLEKNDL